MKLNLIPSLLFIGLFSVSFLTWSGCNGSFVGGGCSSFTKDQCTLNYTTSSAGGTYTNCTLDDGGNNCIEDTNNPCSVNQQ